MCMCRGCSPLRTVKVGTDSDGENGSGLKMGRKDDRGDARKRSRQQAREVALKLIFQIYVKDTVDDKSVDAISFEEDLTAEQIAYVKETCGNVCANVDRIDSLIEAAADNWKLTTMSKIDVALMRLAIGEFCYGDTPPAVAINEAVDMAKKYGTEKSDKFVNGILGKVYALVNTENEE